MLGYRNHNAGERSNAERADLGIDVVVGSLGILVESIGKLVVHVADIGNGAGHVVGRAFALNEAVAGNGNRGVGERSAVVYLAVGRGGHGNIALFNGERAVVHDKLNIAEVCVLVCKLLCREAHIVGAGVSAACGGISAESEVVLCVQRIADGNVIAGNGLLAAVILLPSGIAGDGDGDLIGNGSNAERAEHGIDVVVGCLGIRVESIGKLVVHAADIGDGAGHVVGRTFALNEAVAGNGNRIVGERCFVVYLAVGRGGHGNIALFNGERAVVHDKLNIAEVCVLVCKLLCREAHIVGAGVSAACGGISAESEVVLCIQRIADGDVIAGDGLLGAVVGLGGGIAGDGNSHLAYRVYNELAVDSTGDDVLAVGIDSADGILSKFCRVFTRLSAFRADGDSGEVSAFGCAGEAGNGVLIAVVGHCIAVCGELYVFIIVEVNDIRTRAYGQVTGLIGHSGVSIYSYRSLVGNSITEGLIAHYLGIGDLIRRAVPIVVDGVAQVGAR